MEKASPVVAVHFANLVDPRMAMKNRHLFIDIIVIAICSVIGGAAGWEQIEIFGKAKRKWFSTFLDLPKVLYLKRLQRFAPRLIRKP